MRETLWSRLLGRGRAKAVGREVEEKQMSPAERSFVDESVEDRQSDLSARAFLGGPDTPREGAPPSD